MDEGNEYNKKIEFISTQAISDELPITQLLEANNSMEIDSENCPSYSPSIGQLMEENADQGMDSELCSTSSQSEQQDEVDLLLMESKMPMEEVVKKYGYNENGSSVHDSEETYMDYIKKRRYSNRLNYNEDADLNEMIISRDKKDVSVGPMHQIEVPISPSNKLYTEILDEILWDGIDDDPDSLNQFFQSIKNVKKNICFEDELIMCFYRKHKGNIEAALQDKEELDKIECEQMSPLTDLTSEETLRFKDAMIRCGKKFPEIQHFYYPHKTIKSLVQFYYVWKKSVLYYDYKLELRAVKGKSKEGTGEDTEDINEEEMCNGYIEHSKNNTMDSASDLHPSSN